MGSLFKARDWWQTKCGDNEEFDRNCMVIANIDNDPSGVEKIVCGSFQGMLRIYQPKQKGFRPDDLLLEQSLDLPILQLAAGRFASNSSNILLAVLNPRKFVVYNVQRSGGGAVEGGQNFPLRQYSLSKQYEKPLDRVAYNFINGPFGGAHGRDHYCIQTLDGQLNFFEQEKFYFTRFLSNPSGSERSFLLPGCLCYVPRIDSFVTSTSTFEVECYRYSTLVSSSGSEEKEGSDGGLKLRSDWSVNLGEDVVDIRLCLFQSSSTQTPEILVLGERTLFILKESGEIRQQRRLDYFPSCMFPYVCNPGKAQNLLVGTHSASIMIYNDQKLVWSAKTSTAPVALGVICLAKLEGFIAMLSEDGQLSCSYLGTDPASQPTQLIDTARELDYDDMDEEHRQLQQLIRQAVNAGKSEPDDQIILQYECPSQLDSMSEGLDSPPGGGGKSCTVRLFVSYTGKEDIENVVVTVNVPQPFELPQAQSSIHIDRIEGGGGPQMVPLTFMVSTNPAVACLTPTSLQAEVICCYTSPSGEPLASRCSFFLPMSLAGSVIPPVKNPNYKITLESNLAPPALKVLFDDVLSGNSEATSTNVLSFQYNNSNDVTVLVAKSANRYRIQASHFESLWLLTAELVRRMKIYYAQQGSPLKISHQDSLPFPDYFNTIDDHFKARLQLSDSQQLLSERAHQFRSIQKRLLVRYKDRNPSPLQNLDKLFEDTYRQLLSISEVVDQHQKSLTKASNTLVCSTHLILLLIQYRFDMKKEDIKTFKHYLSPIVVDSPTQGWEECTDAAMTHLLRTSLAKTYKEAMSMPQPLQIPSDTGKLKKHIALVCDRLAKGGSLKNDKHPAKEKP
eukprot:TRINITY_DN1056_c1_g1_i1.p1 TRINITY_DN1056_c1_g1~~TRINITY_DN1056_c1_g1_i1.p1  ORF type:complete len:845 (+),score=132.55 TRINITY_DN1056_c1_g1_i1:68-2602(+)